MKFFLHNFPTHFSLLTSFITSNLSFQKNECPFHARKIGEDCYCDEGYLTVNSEDELTRRVKGDDYCVLAFFSNLIVHKVENEKSLVTIVIRNHGDEFPMVDDYNDSTYAEYEPDLLTKISIQQFSEGSNNPEDIELILDENFIVTEGTDESDPYVNVTFVGLNPGRKYLTSFVIEEHVRFPIVPSCSCSSLTNEDQTGRPTTLAITQNKGNVFFEFTDHSKCEGGFSFSRFLGYAEFVDDSKHATSFTSDFSFQAPQQCNSVITPETEASDDLTISRLPVGQVYSYCVRAIKEGNYMDLTPNAQELRALTSSSAICQTHRVAWESSIAGLVTTDPNAGSLAIKDVHVSWQVVTEGGKALHCSDCFGTTMSDKGGVFNIDLNIQNETELYDKNDDDIAVNLYFSKTTTSNGTDIEHRFLCNEGQDICDPDAGYTVYLKHLVFNNPVHVYDDTSVPLSGTLSIHSTNCPISKARVCPLHKSVSAENLEELTGNLCVESDSYGDYAAPVVIGSVIFGIRIEYEEHEFERTFENKWDYDKGVHIVEDGYFAKNDFYDMSKARLIVQGKLFIISFYSQDANTLSKPPSSHFIAVVAGGLCDLNLGTSQVKMRIKGCAEELHLGGDLEHAFEQTSFEKVYNNIPAHFLDVSIEEVANSEGTLLTAINEYFNGADPIIRSINLVGTGQEDKALEDVIEEEEEDTGDTGTETVDKLEDVEALEEGEDLKETVRFQYDGVLQMDVEVGGDNLQCSDYTLEDEDNIDSFHVVEYMQLVDISMKLKNEIVKDELYCNQVDTERYQIQIESNLGMDTNAGFEEFYNQLPSAQEKEFISKCSSIAPPGGEADGNCVLNIFSTEGGSGLDLKLAVGRPNIAPPYTKNLNIRVLGSDVFHRADFFIEGLFSKGPGDSFALPTHQPLMILRDPP